MIWTEKEKQHLVDVLFEKSHRTKDGKYSLSFDEIGDILNKEGGVSKEHIINILNNLKPSTSAKPTSAEGVK